MINVHDFLNLYSQELRMGASTSTHCTLSYKNGSINYTVYNDKIEFRISTFDDPQYSCHSLVYDAGMDWCVEYKGGLGEVPSVRKHYKQVSKGHDIITSDLYNQILFIKENVVLDHKILLINRK